MLITPYFLSGCFLNSKITGLNGLELSGSTTPVISAPSPLFAPSTSLSLLKPHTIEPSGGVPPYTYSTILGNAVVDNSGRIKSYDLAPSKIKITDSVGSEIIIDIQTSNNDLLSGLNVKSIKFNADKSKGVIGVEKAPWDFRVFTADFDLPNGNISNLLEIATIETIPSLFRVCSLPLINPQATKIVFTADTTPGGFIGECEIWSMDLNGQNAFQISEELTAAGFGIDDMSPEGLTFTEDGLGIVYMDGLNPNYSDNEKDLKVVNLDGTNLRYLHPSLNNDWGVMNLWIVPNSNRVIFNYVKPSSWTDYRTYSARLDGGDFGALVPLTSDIGEVDINSSPLFFSNYTKAYFSNSKDASSNQTVEVANIDGTGRAVVQTGTSGIQIKILDVNDAGRIVFYRTATDVITYTYGGAKVTTLSGLTGYPFSPTMNVYGNNLRYLLSNGQQLRQRNLDGTGDSLISDSSYVGRIRNVLFQPNGDIYFSADKDILYNLDLYHFSATSGQLNRLTPSPLVGVLSGLAVNRIGFLGTSSVFLEVCPGTINFSTWTCNSPLKKMAFDLSGSQPPSTTFPSPPPAGTELFVNPINSIRLINGPSGLSLEWFGL